MLSSPRSEDNLCYGTEAFYILLNDVDGSTQRLISTILSTVFFGITTSLALQSTYILIGKGVTRAASATLLAATLVLYTSTAVFWGAGLHRNVAYTREASAAAAAVSACDANALFNLVHTSAVNDRMSCIQTASLTVNILVGDAVVWWRASMLWMGRSRVAILALCALLLMSTSAISVADTCGACQLDLVREEAGYGQLFSGDRFGAAASILSLLTNAVATALTAYKGWQHARLLRKYFSEGSMGTNVERVVILLVESGMVYSAIWLVVTVYQLGVNTGDNYTTSTNAERPNFWTVIGYFVNGALVPVIAIYPMAIIVLVAMKKSQMARAHSFSTHAQASLSNTLRFAGSYSSSTTRGPSRNAAHVGIKMLEQTPPGDSQRRDTVEETKQRVDDEV